MTGGGVVAGGPPEGELYTVAEAVKIMSPGRGISVRWLQDELASGRWPYYDLRATGARRPAYRLTMPQIIAIKESLLVPAVRTPKAAGRTTATAGAGYRGKRRTTANTGGGK